MIRLIHHRPTPIRSGLPPGHWSARHYFGRVPVLSLPFYALGATGAALPFAPALPVSALMASVPIIAALSLVWHQNGAAAAGSLLNSAFNLRTIPGAGWIVFAMCVLPVAFALTGGLVWLSGTVLPNLIVLPASTIIPAFALFFLGAAGEELGWQGYAYPTLWQTHSVPGAALILGVVWAVWHVIPLRMMGRGADWILWHSAAMVLMRIVIVWLVVNTGRSILIAAVFHMMSNSVWGTFHDFSRWYDPMFMSAILAVAVAVILSVRGLGPLLPKDRRMP